MAVPGNRWMKTKRLITLSLTGFLVCLITTGLSWGNSALRNSGIADSYHHPLEQSQIEGVDTSMTVKVISGSTSGSGIIIAHRGNTYTVVTNHHVLIFGREKQNYSIKTLDNQVHLAQVIPTPFLKGYDLGLLRFDSSRIYTTANISSVIETTEKVWAVGFPAETGELFLQEGEIETITDKPFAGGYRLGFTASIKKGMSGGPLLNDRSEVIGINGIHKYPLWGNPYTFEDGTQAGRQEQSQMSQLSWAIPMETLIELIPEYVDM